MQLRNELNEILECVSKTTNVPLVDIVGKKRNQPISDARRLFVKVVTEKIKHDGLTLRQVGELVGLDHSTVIYYKKTAQDLIDSDRRFRRLYDRVMAMYLPGQVEFNNIPQL